LFHASGFVPGEHFGKHGRDTNLMCDGLGGASIVAGHHHRFDAE